MIIKFDNKKLELFKGIFIGMGFFIFSDGYVFINSYVIEGLFNILIILNGKFVLVILVDYDFSNDIVLLKVDKVVEGLLIEFKNKIK